MMTPSPSPVTSLLDKYPHLRKLAARRLEDVKKHNTASDNHENAEAEGGRISLLGPGVGEKHPKLIQQQPLSTPRGRVDAEQLFAASVAADDDRWLQFQVEADIPAREQMDGLKVWLVANRPSTIARSTGVGWIAVKFKDKGKKVLEAKAAWDGFEGEKTMEVVNQLAKDFHVMGGKWMCHLPSALIDDMWSKLALALMCGGLGPSVYMVKVSPVEDIDPNLSRGEHVICVYNIDYQDTEQVMRVENLMRSAGVATVLNYKPDIFSALGIYRNNKWGFRPTIYSSKVMTLEGRSRVETVGTGKWYYNSSKGMQYPSCQDRDSLRMVEHRKGQDNDKSNVCKNDKDNPSEDKKKTSWSHRLTSKKVEEKPNEVHVPSNVEDEKKDLNDNVSVSCIRSTNFSMNRLDMMQREEDRGSKGQKEYKSGWSHRLAPKKDNACVEDLNKKVENAVFGASRTKTTDSSKAEIVLPGKKSWSDRLDIKNTDESPHKVTEKVPVDVHTVSDGKENAKEADSVHNNPSSNKEKKDVEMNENVDSTTYHKTKVKKPIWMLKLEQMKLKNLEEMKK